MKLGVEKIKGLIEKSRVDGRGKNVYGICPKCGHDEFGISLENNHRFGCFRKGKCGFAGNIFTLLKYLGVLGDYIGDGEGYSRTEEKLVKRIISEERVIDLFLPKSDLPLGWKRVVDNEYLNGRGFTEKDYAKFKPGMTRLDTKLRDNYIIFPIEEEDEVKGWVARHTWSKERLKAENILRKQQGLREILRYRNSDDDFSKIVLGIEEVTENTKVLIFVEGLFDKQNIDKLLDLDSDESTKCLCTFKCQVSLEQILKIKQKTKAETVILLYDNDVIDQIKKVGLELMDYFETVLIGLPKTHDPGDMDYEELSEILNILESPVTFATSKIQKKKLL